MDLATLQSLDDARFMRQPYLLVTRLPDGSAERVASDDFGDHPLADLLAERFSRGTSGIVAHEETEYFIQIERPAPRLVMIGAVHISQALHPMARACGFDVLIVDPRTAFATPERFDGVDVHAEWPIDVANRLALDPETAFVALTHDPKIDDDPLVMALEQECFYVGALGSRKTHGKRRDRLEPRVGTAAVERIHAPIGLDIGAASPAEIAVAIMAEIINAYRNRGRER